MHSKCLFQFHSCFSHEFVILFMDNKCSTGKNTSGPNQPPSCEVKYSIFYKPLEFPNFIFSKRYSPHIPSQSTPNPTNTSSPENTKPNQDSYFNEELHGITPKDFVYRIPNNKVDQLHRHTPTYLQSIGQILIIYQIPRSQASHRITQPYGEDENLTSSIDDIIINTTSEIRQLIAAIAHSETREDPKFQNLLDFLQEYSTFYDFPQTQVGGSRHFGPPEKTPLVPTLNIPNQSSNLQPIWQPTDLVLLQMQLLYLVLNIPYQNILRRYNPNLIQTMMLHLRII